MKSNEFKEVGVKAFRNRGIIFAVLAVIMIIVGSVMIAKPFSEFSKRLSWKQTEGEIFGFEKVLSDQKLSDQNFVAVVDFPITEKEFIEIKGEPQKNQPNIGEKVKVYYDEKDPQAAVIGEYSILKVIPLVAMLIVGVISAVLSFLCFRKMRNLKNYKNAPDANHSQSPFVQNFMQNDKGGK